MSNNDNMNNPDPSANLIDQLFKITTKSNIMVLLCVRKYTIPRL